MQNIIDKFSKNKTQNEKYNYKYGNRKCTNKKS